MKTLLSDLRVRIAYEIEGTQHKHSFVGSYQSEHLDVTLHLNENQDISSIQLSVHPHQSLTMHALIIELKHSFHKDETIFVNGYQSWTDSREFFIKERMHTISKLAYPLLEKYQFDKYGDTNFKKTSRRAGDLHGYTYAYLRRDDHFTLMGSLSELNGFTIFNTSVKDGMIWIEKDCKDLVIDHRYDAFDLVFTEGEENAVFDAYFKAMNIDKPKAKHMTGWTSWYNYYQNISEDIIVKNLEALSSANKQIDIAQVDDGYQSFIGDWLDVDQTKFPNGMKHIAHVIHAKGYKAGLWLAPFVCETNSRIYKEHPDWIQKDKQGNLALAGGNWSRFYALNLELPEVKAYIKHVFDVVLIEWNYDLVKLDFLYAVCMHPTKNKTRGQIMCEAMDFLRACVGDKLILACGVPLGPSFGKVDYCRIGCDVGLDWNDKAYMRLFHRERVSTLNALGNTVGRRQLNRRAFINDPDVFFFREDNIQLTQTQKETVAFVNKHFGDLLFTSDDITQYTASQHRCFDETMHTEKIEILSVKRYRNKRIDVLYLKENVQYEAKINLDGKDHQGIPAYATVINEVMEEKG